MAAPSDDRNGVVVNRARRGTCDRLNNRHSETVGRAEVHQGENRSSEIHAKSEYEALLVRPKSGFLQRSTYKASLSVRQLTASRKSQQHVREIRGYKFRQQECRQFDTEECQVPTTGVKCREFCVQVETLNAVERKRFK